jgi:hypothetical protein
MGVKQMVLSFGKKSLGNEAVVAVAWAHRARHANLTLATEISTLSRRAGLDDVRVWAAASAMGLTPNALVRVLQTTLTIRAMNATGSAIPVRDQQQSVRLLRSLAAKQAEPTPSAPSGTSAQSSPLGVPRTRAEFNTKANGLAAQIREATARKQHDSARQLLGQLKTLEGEARALPQFKSWADSLSTLTRELEKSINHSAQTDANLLVGMADVAPNKKPDTGAEPATAISAQSQTVMAFLFFDGNPAHGRTVQGEKFFELAKGGELESQLQNFEGFVAKSQRWPIDLQYMVVLHLQGVQPGQIAKTLVERYPQTKLIDAAAVQNELSKFAPVGAFIDKFFGSNAADLAKVLPPPKPVSEVSAWLYHDGAPLITDENFVGRLTPNGLRLYELTQGSTPAKKRQAFTEFVGSWAKLPAVNQEILLLSLQGSGMPQIVDTLQQRYPQKGFRYGKYDAGYTPGVPQSADRIARVAIRTAFGLTTQELLDRTVPEKPLLPAVSAFLFRSVAKHAYDQKTFAVSLTAQGERLYQLARGYSPAEKQKNFENFVFALRGLGEDAQEAVLLLLQGVDYGTVVNRLLEKYPATELINRSRIASRLTNSNRAFGLVVQTCFGLTLSELKSAIDPQAVAIPSSPQSSSKINAARVSPAAAPPASAEPKSPVVATSLPPPAAPPAEVKPPASVKAPEPASPATRSLSDPSLPLLTQVERYWTEHTAHLPLLQTIKADAAELAQAVDAYNQSLPAGKPRLELSFQQVMAVALYRRDASLKRNPQDGSVLFTLVNVNRKHEGNRQALSTFLNADAAALESSGLQAVFSALSRSYEPANFDPQVSANTHRARALHYLDQFLGNSGQTAAVSPERQAALQALDLMRLTGALSAEQANDVGALLMPSRANTVKAATPNWKSVAGVVDRDIRTYPYSTHNRRQTVEQRRKNAQALVEGLGGSLDVGDSKTQQPTSFLFQVGLRALRDAHREGVDTLLTQAWRTGRAPSAVEIRSQLFPSLKGEVRYVRAVVQALVEEVHASIGFALAQRQLPGWSAQPLSAVQAAAAHNMEMLITDVATSGEANKKARYVLSLPQAADNRRATYAVLARLGPQMPRDVFVWTTSKFLAEGVVPAEAKAALGDRFEIITTAQDLTVRLADRTSRKKPLLVVLGDDALSTAGAQVSAWMASCAKSGRRVVYVADEAQRLGRSDDSQRARALAPLAQQSQVAIALSATPIGRKGNELGAMAQWLGVLPAGELPRSPSLLFTQIAPHFLSGAAQRLAPTPHYVSVTYSPQAAQLALQNLRQNTGVERHTLGAQLDAVEKMPTVVALAQKRVAANGKVLIGSSYLKDGVDAAAAALGATKLRHAKLDGRTPVAQRNELLRRFKLPAADPQALDVLVSTWTAAEGSVAVDARQPPPGGFEVIGLNVPQTPAYLAALTGMVNQEDLGQEVPVRVSIPVMQFKPGQAGTGAASASADQQAVDRFEQRTTASANALSMGSGDMVEPTHSQLERYRLGRGYTGMSNEYFGTVEELETYMEANDLPPPWQQATRYLDRQVATRATQLAAQNKRLRLADLGSGFNRLVTTAVKNNAVSPEHAVGLDLLPKEMVTQLVQRGKLGRGSDTLHVTGRIEDAAALLAPWTRKAKFNLVTSSFSLMGKEPQLIASYFRAANQILETGGRLMVLLPLSSFSASRDAAFKQGLAEMGFTVKNDEALKTVGASIRYLELERIKDPVPRVDVQKFLMK